eukprot:GHVT01062689.1.p1 GENE.GHVT01062689.1~~GHVT01062689.1.p1  ORF type:complete len:770 (+),score=100.61 GHVT01062689.1:269-2578(+)
MTNCHSTAHGRRSPYLKTPPAGTILILATAAILLLPFKPFASAYSKVDGYSTPYTFGSEWRIGGVSGLGLSRNIYNDSYDDAMPSRLYAASHSQSPPLSVRMPLADRPGLPSCPSAALPLATVVRDVRRHTFADAAAAAATDSARSSSSLKVKSKAGTKTGSTLLTTTRMAFGSFLPQRLLYGNNSIESESDAVGDHRHHADDEDTTEEDDDADESDSSEEHHDSTGSSRKNIAIPFTPSKHVMYTVGGLAVVGGLGYGAVRRYISNRRQASSVLAPSTFSSDSAASSSVSRSSPHVPLTDSTPPSLSSLLGEDLVRMSKPTDSDDAPAARGLFAAARRLIGIDGQMQTVRTESVAKEVKDNSGVVALYFSGSGVEDLLKKGNYPVFTPRLREIYEQCQKAGKKLEIVYIALDKNRSVSKVHFKTKMPWYSLPFSSKSVDRVRSLLRQFRLSSVPSVVLLDGDGRLLNAKGYTAMLVDGVEGFPWKKKTIYQMLGDRLIDSNNNVVDKESLKGKTLGLYFSASWCAPCRRFTPKLREVYKRLKAEGREFEVVFVSNDESATKFQEYFSGAPGSEATTSDQTEGTTTGSEEALTTPEGTVDAKEAMPWLAIPFADAQRRAMLQDELGVGALPTLVMLDSSGKVITANACGAVTRDPAAESYPWTPKPVLDIADTLEGFAEKPVLLVFMEGVGKATQESIEKALHTVATAQRATQEAEDGSALSASSTRNLAFFTAKSQGPRNVALRRLVRLPAFDLSTTGGGAQGRPKMV